MAAILIVEDEEKIARFVELELQHEGYETGKATDGLSGLSLAESSNYDLMILDIMLPGISGLGLSIAKWIVDRHHAVIEVVSFEGMGSRITIKMPVYEKKS